MKKLYIGLVLASIFLGTLVLLSSLNVVSVVATSSSGDECQDDIDCGEPSCSSIYHYIYGSVDVVMEPTCEDDDPYGNNYCRDAVGSVCSHDEYCFEGCHTAQCQSD